MRRHLIALVVPAIAGCSCDGDGAPLDDLLQTTVPFADAGPLLLQANVPLERSVHAVVPEITRWARS